MQTLQNARSRTVTSSSARFTDPLKEGAEYRFASDVDCWFMLGAESATVAASAVNAVQVFGGIPVYFTPHQPGGLYLHVIRSAVDGTANLAEVIEV